MALDSNERLIYLDSNNLNDTAKRLIEATANAIKTIKAGNSVNSADDIFAERARAIRNQLFIKYTGMEYESLFQSIFIDRKYSKLV
jgi:hypothetical protein